MPRRRGSKANSAPKAFSRTRSKKDSQAVTWNQRSDIPLDDEEQFHESRDRILLEGDESGGDSDGDEDEVFALQGVETSEDEGNSVAEGGGEGDEAANVPPPRLKGKQSKKSSTKPSSPGSESESSSSEEEESWGKNKSAYYSSNMDQLESDDEEANDMEEEEARRLQAKLRATLNERDFGLDMHALLVDEEPTDLTNEDSRPIPTIAVDKSTILRNLQRTNPEALALAQEWDDIAHSIMKSTQKMAELEADPAKYASSLGLIHLHHHTQVTYASVLAFYLYLRSSEKYAAKPDLLRSHPIMQRLLELKQSLSTLEDLGFGFSDSEVDSDSLATESDFSLGDGDLSLSALNELGDSDEFEFDASPARPAKKVKFFGSDKADTKKDKKSDKQKKVVDEANLVVPLALDLVEPNFSHKRSSTKKSQDLDLYGESTSLDAADAVDKGVRRKALRFHTQKIESASSRRQGARNAMAGDDDIPYRERRKQQAGRKPRKDLGVGGDDLDDVDPEAVTNVKKRGRSEDREDEFGGGDDDDDDDGYYALVKKQKREANAEKKARYEAERLAARPHIEEDAVTGQRSVTRAIMANKGLTPHRSKSVRNPRVKKRKRFEKAKKKLASQKAVYKGGIGDAGHYGGEQSGISKVVKSIKL